MKVIKTKMFFGALFFCVVFISVALFSSVSADDVVDIINITVPVSCTISGTGMNTHNAEIQNGTYQANIGTTTLHAFCNDNNGFAFYAAGYTGNEIGGTNSNKLVGTSASSNATIVTGLATSTPNPDVSNWAMKLAITQDSGDTTGTNAFTIDSAPNTSGGADASFSQYHTVPNEYVKVAHKNSATDMTANTGGVKLTTTYAAYISKTQPADTYTGQVIYTLVHPVNEIPAQPQPSTPGYINYYANSNTAEGTMGRQSASDGNEVKLFASNFSRDGYGFAGWSDAYDYATNPNANFYGPNEDIIVPTGTTANGLSLYAVWIPSAGLMQDSAKVASLCDNNGSLTTATYNNEGDSDESTWSITADLSSVSALTDTRDGQTYAIAKLTDGRCWMIENLRLADKDSSNNNIDLSSANTNNPALPLTNVYDLGTTSNHLSPTSNVAYNADTAPEGWCTSGVEAATCLDQSRLLTDNTVNRATYTPITEMSSNVNLYSYGNYYNWYSATAGNGKYSTDTGTTVPGDLCPTGWHLPTGSGSGEFGLLSNSLGGYKDTNNVAQRMNSTTTPTATIMLKRISHFPVNLIYSGAVTNGSVTSLGSGGGYWTSTTPASLAAYGLQFSSSNVYPGRQTFYKQLGRTIRCVANSAN